MAGEAGPEPSETDLDQNRNARAMVERLRQAVRRVGTVQKLAELSGVPFGSLRGYLAGREMKGSTIAAIADACGVSIEWLVAGRGPMRPDEPPPEPAPVSIARHSIDVDRLAAAMDKALQILAGHGHQGPPPTRRFAAIVEVLYSDFSDEEVSQVMERLRHETR